jgi:hypothetical protein
MTDSLLIKEKQEITSFKLTQELYTRQQRETPVTLNSLIAACLLNSNGDLMPVQDIINQTTMFFNYLKIKRSAPTFMQTKPTQILVEKHIEGLGFKLQDKGKKTSQIVLKGIQ